MINGCTQQSGPVLAQEITSTILSSQSACGFRSRYYSFHSARNKISACTVRHLGSMHKELAPGSSCTEYAWSTLHSSLPWRAMPCRPSLMLAQHLTFTCSLRPALCCHVLPWPALPWPALACPRPTPQESTVTVPARALFLLLALCLVLGCPLPLSLGVYPGGEWVLILQSNEVDGKHPGSQEDACGPAI